MKPSDYYIWFADIDDKRLAALAVRFPDSIDTWRAQLHGAARGDVALAADCLIEKAAMMSVRTLSAGREHYVWLPPWRRERTPCREVRRDDHLLTDGTSRAATR